MKTVKVKVLQTWFDISIQHTGSVYNALDIAHANERSIAEDLIAGESLIIPDGLPMASKELQYYQARNIAPATAETIVQDEDYAFPLEFPISF